jgi:hypothetical protein
MIDTEAWGELAELDPEMAEFLVDEFMQCIVDDYSDSRQAGIVGLDEEFYILRTPIVLDPKGIREALKASEKYEAEMMRIVDRSTERRLQAGTDEVPVSFSIVWFKMPKREKPKS